MALASLDRISLSFSGDVIVKNVALQIQRGDRLGIVGRNGSGKTTLLKIILGLLKPDQGAISLEKGLRIGYLSQIPSLGDEPRLLDVAISGRSELLSIRTRIEALQDAVESGDAQAMSALGELQERYEREGGDDLERRAAVALQNVGFDPERFEQPTSVLSGGERSRLMLARILVMDADLLLLDEPTNHLDLRATEFLEQYLASFKGGAVVVSHDRAFLDRFATALCALESDGTLETYPGSYEQFLTLRAQRRESAKKQYDQQQAYIERTEELIRRTHVGQKAKQAKSRQKALERLDPVAAAAPEDKTLAFQFPEVEPSGKMVIQVKGLSLQPGGQTLLEGAEFRVDRGEKIGIIGPNGCGKTTLLKALTLQEQPAGGKVIHGYRVIVGMYDQTLSGLTMGRSVLDELAAARPELGEQALRDLAGRFLFRGDEVFRQVESFSGGEQSRLALALLVLGRYNALLLDEPTNHLDIPSCEVLEEALRSYPGMVIVVSHDRFFLDRMANRILSFEARSLVDELGRYSELRKAGRIMGGVPQEAPVVDPAKVRKREAFEKRRQNLRSRETLEKRLQELEALIHQKDQDIERLMAEMSDPALAFDWEGLDRRQNEKRAHEKDREVAYREWEQVTGELERVAN